jgi:hypothetical protein
MSFVLIATRTKESVLVNDAHIAAPFEYGVSSRKAGKAAANDDYLCHGSAVKGLGLGMWLVSASKDLHVSPRRKAVVSISMPLCNLNAPRGPVRWPLVPQASSFALCS